LNLSSNKLKTIPDEIGLLQNLETLKLEKNYILATEQEKLRKLLPNTEITF